MRPMCLKKAKKSELTSPSPPEKRPEAPRPLAEPPGGGGEGEEEEEVLCPLCSELYEGEEERQPVLLPRCGHTFCRSCLSRAEKRGHFPCPTCRKRHLKPPVAQIPAHAHLLARAEAFRESKLGRCDSHGEPLEFWCRECQRALCGSCPVGEGHGVVRCRSLLKEKRREMRDRGEEVLRAVREEKLGIVEGVKGCALQLLKSCEESALAEGWAQDARDMLGDARRASSDVRYVLGSLRRMAGILRSLRKGAPEGGEEELPPPPPPEATPKLRRRRKAQEEEVEEERKKAQQKKERERKKGFLLPASPSSCSPLLQQARKETGYAHYSQMYGAVGTSGRVRAQMATSGPLLKATDPSLWPLRCCAFSDDGRGAALTWVRGRLHMSALGDGGAEGAHFLIKISVIQSLIPEDAPEVFLDLRAGETPLGRVHIRLWGRLRRAQHFLSLCTGVHGPSYRGARFQEVYSRGAAGECLHAGPYEAPGRGGGLTTQGLMEGLEWDGAFRGPQRAGLVVGAGSGRPDRDSCFDVCTRGNPGRNFACPFGEVVGGWEAVLRALDHRPVRAVVMADVGLVLPLGAS